MKTVDNVLHEMRYGVIPKHRHDRELLMNFADLVEAAVKTLEADRDNWRRQALDEDARANATHKDSLEVGNAAAMFKALKQIDRIVWDKRRHTKEEVEAHRLATEALTRPPRNCDLCANAQEALASIHNDRCYVQNPIDERRLTVKWLFAEAKGEQK